MSIAEEAPDDQPVRRVHVRAPGKVNLFLGVGDLDDDGYHELSTVFQAVSLSEDVIATPADDFTISVSGVADPSTVPLDDRNLAMRAAKLLAAATGYAGERTWTCARACRSPGDGRRIRRCRGRPRRLQRAVAHGARPRSPAGARSQARRRCALLAPGRHRRRLRARRCADPRALRGRYEWVLLLDDEGCPLPRCTGLSTW